MTTNYNAQLDELFKEWEAASQQNGHAITSKDSLMRMRGQDVNELWDKADRRVMFLLKDQPKGGGDDIRNWLTLPDDNKYAKINREASPSFLKRLACLLYSFTYGNTEHWDFDMNEVVKCFLETPFALVETKKQSGGNSVSDKEMTYYINQYKDFLLREIEILNPNIIVCCGGPQHHFALNTLYSPDSLETIDKNVHYDRQKNVVIIYAGHPSARCSHYNYLEGALHHYRLFLQQYPDSVFAAHSR